MPCTRHGRSIKLDTQLTDSVLVVQMLEEQGSVRAPREFSDDTATFLTKPEASGPARWTRRGLDSDVGAVAHTLLCRGPRCPSREWGPR